MKPVILLLCLSFNGFAQVHDSLYNNLEVASSSEEKALAYSNLASAHVASNLDSSEFYLNKATPLFMELTGSRDKVIFLERNSVYHSIIEDFEKSIQFALNAMAMAKRINEPDLVTSIARSLNDRVYLTHGDFDEALKLALDVQLYAKNSKDSTALYRANKGLADVYFLTKSNPVRQSELSQENLQIALALNDSDLLLTAYFSRALAIHKEDPRKALESYEKAVSYGGSEFNFDTQSRIMNNMGSIYGRLGQVDSAKYCFNKAYEFSKEANRIEGMAAARLKLGNLLGFTGDLEGARIHCSEALQLFKEANILRRQDACLNCLYEVEKGRGNFELALNWFEQSTAVKDSFFNLSALDKVSKVQKDFAVKETMYRDSLILSESEKLNAAKLEAKDAKLKQDALKEERDRYINYGLGLLVVLIAIFGFYMFRKFRASQLQKLLIQDKNSQLAEKNKEITDSINYAKRIQNAILPSEKVVKSLLPNSFILYEPKDIVAGDFFWLEPIEGGVLFAAADCTGHGVPGAMVSVVCNNGLNRSVREFGLSDPGQILDKTRELVIHEFGQSDGYQEEEEVKDGMDIALCCLRGITLHFSGAHNPLWIVKGDTSELIEIKANKQPIGKFDHATPYSTHRVELSVGDTFYLFSDGMIDQFGGPKGKKFKSSNFKKLLISIKHQSMEEQKRSIFEAFEKWKGWGGHPIEQLDDICIIGVRV